MYQFEKLEVWKEALDLIDSVYKKLEKLPQTEKFALCDQLKRASVSVALNIAEGRGKSNDEEFRHFLNISLGSLFEVIAGFKVAIRLGYLKEEELNEIFEISDKLGAKIGALRKSLLQSSNISNLRE